MTSATTSTLRCWIRAWCTRCGYWKDAKNLDEAQEAKLDLVCRKIGLKSGDRILDVGCGWGSFAKFAAEKYGASVVGVTVSVEQRRSRASAVKDCRWKFAYKIIARGGGTV